MTVTTAYTKNRTVPDPMGLCFAGVFGSHCGGVVKTLLEGGINVVDPGLGSILANNTTEVCVGGSLGAVVGFNGSVCVGQSHLDQVGVSATKAFGWDVPGSAGVFAQPVISNAKHFGDLGGPFTYGGGSLGPFTGEGSWGTDKCGDPVNLGALGLQLDITDAVGTARYGHSDTATATLSLPW